MFTGLISDVGEVVSVAPRGDLRRMRIACGYSADTLALGASIACSGPCLTIVGAGAAGSRSWFDVDVGAETLLRTTAASWTVGTRLNLERPLRLGDELGGHIVSGHVDGVAHVVSRGDKDGMAHFEIEAPAALARFIAEKGSVALDGTSLTVNSVEGRSFSILLIPHTLGVTAWGAVKAGGGLNLEVDMMARYAARLMEKLSPR